MDADPSGSRGKLNRERRAQNLILWPQLELRWSVLRACLSGFRLSDAEIVRVKNERRTAPDFLSLDVEDSVSLEDLLLERDLEIQAHVTNSHLSGIRVGMRVLSGLSWSREFGQLRRLPR